MKINSEWIVVDTVEKVLDKELNVRHIKKRESKQTTIVFLHEGLGCVELWKKIPEWLAKTTGLNVLIYERQGHGQSSPLDLPRPLNYLEIEAQEYLPQLLQQLKISHPILLGHSDGATIALLYAACYPVKMLITAAAHVLVEDITIKGVQEAADNYHKNKLRTKLEKYHGAKAHDLFWAWANTWLNSDFKNWNVAHFLPNITCPTLLIQGVEDEYATLEQLDLIANGIGVNAQKVAIENCAHSPHIQAKGRFLELISIFINENL